MSDDEHIDAILNLFTVGNSCINLHGEYHKRAKIKAATSWEIISLMEHKKLIKQHRVTYYILDAWGIEIKRMGGWLKHLEGESNKQLKQKKEEETEEKRK